MTQILASEATQQVKPQHTTPQGDDVSLSRYFPSDTVYFYAFPAGEESSFYNAVPPWIEELVAARPLICAGSRTKVLTFAAPSTSEIRGLLEDECGLSMIRRDQIVRLPDHITPHITGDARNKIIKSTLRQMMRNRQLVMAQPFLDDELEGAAQIAPKLTVWLNDKKNLFDFIPAQYLMGRLSTFENGADFAASKAVELPCVVKVSSSSAGDGVRVCLDQKSFDQAQNDLQVILKSNIIVEKYVRARDNYCVQFAIPQNRDQQIEIVGQNRQLTSDSGAFFGAVVNPADRNPVLQKIYAVLLQDILPRVRSLGWYGVGGIDVLIGDDDNFYFIDANFRMTATFAFVCQARNRIIKKPLISFVGSFSGSLDEFRRNVLAHAVRGSSNQMLDMLAVTKLDGTYWFNAGMLFDHPESIIQNASDLMKLGIKAPVLSNLISNQNLFYRWTGGIGLMNSCASVNR